MISSAPRLLILETSGPRGQVALATGSTLLTVRSLDEARRHARDLAPAVAGLLAQQQWRPRDVEAVIVSLGPGSYTGLRVGVMSAKAFAFATGCAIAGVETFRAIAQQTPDHVRRVDVIADAQKNNVYLQSYLRDSAWRSISELRIQPFSEWLAQRPCDAWVTGPGLQKWRTHLPAEVAVVDEAFWEPCAESLIPLGLARLAEGGDKALSLEPLYLRPSSAEEQWRSRGGAAG